MPSAVSTAAARTDRRVQRGTAMALVPKQSTEFFFLSSWALRRGEWLGSYVGGWIFTV